MEDKAPRNVWPMGRVMEVVCSHKRFVRRVKIKTDRPADKLDPSQTSGQVGSQTDQWTSWIPDRPVDKLDPRQTIMVLFEIIRTLIVDWIGQSIIVSLIVVNN